MKVGFIGLGVMGQPMAMNLLRVGLPLVVWARSADVVSPFRNAGAAVANGRDQLLQMVDAVVLMLRDEEALDAVLRRSDGRLAAAVQGRLLINMGTVSPGYAAQLAQAVREAGGRYVEAPVSGSRPPAEAGTLIALAAGEPEDIERACHVLKPMCARVFDCGRPPAGTRMKLAVNAFLITMATGLVEAFALAEAAGLDLEQFRDIIDSGPMSSGVSRAKLRKLLAGDFTPEATISDVLKNARLVASFGRGCAAATPLAHECLHLYRRAASHGHGHQDLAAVINALRSSACSSGCLAADQIPPVN